MSAGEGSALESDAVCSPVEGASAAGGLPHAAREVAV